MATKEYGAADVRHLTNREAVREKPSMYLGEPGEACAFTVVREVLDNVVDEALNGHATCANFYADEDGSFWVWDDGRGMPVGAAKVEDSVSGKIYSMPALQAITGLLHAGAKLSQGGEAYKVSRGSHGIGIKGTNFTSHFFQVWTKPPQGWHYIEYKEGKLVTETQKCAAPEIPNSKGKLDKGTLVHFKPNAKVIGAAQFPPKFLAEWATVAAYFTPKFKINAELANGKKKTWYFPDGPRQYIKDKLVQLEATPLMEGKEFFFQNPLVSCVVAFTNHGECEMAAFTNGLRQQDRGVHFTAFFAALQSAITPYIKPRQKFTMADMKDGVVGLVNVMLSAPKFGGQTKEKLVDDRADKPLKDMLTDALAAFFKANKGLADKLCERAQALSDLRKKFVAGKALVNEVKKRAKSGLPAKAQTAPGCKPAERELFLLEGDSASGTAREARDPHFQECLPLRGKIKNAMRSKLDEVLLSEEVLNILVMLGFDARSENPMEKLRVGKLVFLADPDPDGPLDGDTPLWVHLKDQWLQVRMEDLASEEWKGQNYHVVSFDHRQNLFVLAPVAGCNVVGVPEHGEEVTIRWANGTKTTCSPKHRWTVHTPKFISVGMREVNKDGESPSEGELQYLRADQLKAGDRILGVGEVRPGTLRHPKHQLGRNEGVYMTVSSVKRKSAGAAHAKYCLTVPKYHNFVLGNGAVTGNCHINSLLCALIWKILPNLFYEERVYVAELPEFYAMVGKEAVFGNNPRDLREKLNEKGAPKNTQLHHVKGYGELPPSLLARIAFDPATRNLSKIVVNGDESGVEFTKLMSDDPEVRKRLMGV